MAGYWPELIKCVGRVDSILIHKHTKKNEASIRGANHSEGFGSSCTLTDLAI